MASTLHSRASSSRLSARNDTTDQAVNVPPTTAVAEDVNMNASQEPTLSLESRRRSNIFGILHSETTTTAVTIPTDDSTHVGQTTPPRVSASPRPARMSVDSLVHRDGERYGEGFLAVLRDGMGHHGDPSVRAGHQNGQLEDGRRSISPTKGKSDGMRLGEEMVLDMQGVEDEPMPSSRRASLQAAEMEQDKQDQSDGLEDDHDPSSGEEDEVQIDGAINGDDDNEEDEDESSDDDDEDEEGSIDLEEQDNVGDSPVFISMRDGPLGIPDLLLPPAGDVVRVKMEPEDHAQSQGGSSDVVLLGSRLPSPISPLNAVDSSGPMEVVPVDGPTNGAESVPAVIADPAVNVLVARPKKKKARPRSPSPPPPPPPKVRTTIRVVFNLFDDEEGPDGKVVKPEIKDEPKPETPNAEQPDVPMDSNDQETEIVAVEKPAGPKPGEEPKFRVVNFKEASIAQGKVDTDYYVVNSGWNATESEGEDDDEADDMDGDGASRSKASKKKFRELLPENAVAGTSAAGAQEPPPTAPGILEAMLGGADAAELERLAAELDRKYNAKSVPKRKRPDPTDDYDYKDPFIDDSDMQMDEVMIMHRPAKEGFYVQKGAVELISDDEDSGRKPKGKKQTTLNFGKVTPKESPAESDVQPGEQTKRRKKLTLGRGFRPQKAGASASAGPSKPGLSLAELAKGTSFRSEKVVQSSRKASVGMTAPAEPVKETSPEVTAGADPRGNVPAPMPEAGPPANLDEALARLPEELQHLLLDVNKLNQDLSDEDWKAIKESKKFPESFKPVIYTMGKKAVELGLIGDTLYDALPFVIRYNKFTMKKYMLDKMKEYQAEYYERVKSELVPVLKSAIDRTMPKQVSDFKALQDKYDAAIRAEEETAKLEGREPVKLNIQPPLQRIRWSDDMKQVFYRLGKAADNAGKFEAARVEIVEKHSKHSLLYQKRNQLFAEIEPLFPKGWMSSSQLSRQMISLKARYEKQGN